MHTKAGCPTVLAAALVPPIPVTYELLRAFLSGPRYNPQYFPLLRDYTLLNNNDRANITLEAISLHCLHLEIGITQKLQIMQNIRYSLYFPSDVPNRQDPIYSKSKNESQLQVTYT